MKTSGTRHIMTVLLAALVTGLTWLAATPARAAQCAPFCIPGPLQPICVEGFRGRADIPLPPGTPYQTLYFDDVPIPPPAIKGVVTEHAVFGTNHGFRFDGAFYSSGIGTWSDFSHSAVFWHDQADYRGFEYGFYSDLRNGVVFFYVCGDCNTVNQNWSEAQVHGNHLNGVSMSYDVQVTSTGDFQVTARRRSDGSLVSASTFGRPSWMPNLHGIGGYVTAVFQSRRNDAVFHDSYLDLRGLLVYSDQCQ